MADDLSLLFRLRGENRDLKSTIADSRSAIAQLRQSSVADFNALSGVATASVSNVSQSLTNFVQRAPVVGSAASKISSEFSSMAEGGEQAAAKLESLLATLGPVGIAAAGVVVQLAAVAAGATVVVKVTTSLAESLFDVTKSAADFRGKLLDMSQQTGVSVETLSALEIAAARVGTSIEGIVGPLGIFQKHLDESRDLSSKAAKTFEQLGVDTSNTETALRDTLAALAKMPEGFRQTALALELFGRGGRTFLAILKETGGDLDSVTRKLEELGVVVSTEDAKAADEFNDQLALLQFQLRALLGKEAVPAVTEAIKELQNIVSQIRGPLSALSSLIGLELKGNLIVAKAPLDAFNNSLAGDSVRFALVAYERIARAVGIIATTDFSKAAGGVSGSEAFAFGIDVGAGAGLFRKSQATERKAAIDKAAADAAKEIEQQRHLTEQLRLDRERRGGDIEGFYKREKKIVDDHLKTLEAQIEEERRINREAFTAGGIEQEEFDKKRRELDQRATEAKNKHDEEIQRLKLTRDRALVQEEVRFREQQSAIEEARRQGELDRLKVALEKNAQLESSVLTKQLEFLTKNHEERVGIIKFELDAESTSAERQEELKTQLKVLNQEYTDDFKRLSQERIDAINREQAARAPGATGISGDVDLSGIGAKIEEQLGPPPWMADTTDAFGSLGEAMAGVLGMGEAVGQIFGDVLASTFSNLANAVGQAVQSFILFGKVEGGLRKFAAEVIAQIAAMATVQAVYQLAQGLAWLALNFFFPNPAYAKAAATAFTSAAVFGSIAGVATVAGRVISGGAFAQHGDSGGGGSSSGSGGSGPTSAPKPIDIDRRSGVQVGGGVIEIRFKGDAGDFLEAKWIDRYNSGGRLRNTVIDDGRH